MFILYTSPLCPYCKKVERVLEALNLPFEERVITNPVYRDELVMQGGKLQVPFFVDSTQNIKLYESDEIIAYVTAYAQ